MDFPSGPPTSLDRSHARHDFPRVALLATLALASLTATLAHAQSVDPHLWVANSAVRSIASDGSTLYIGGDFTEVGPATGCAVPIDSVSGAPLASFPRVEGYFAIVYSVIDDGAGGWYIGGTFSSVGGQAHNGLAHILADGSVDPWHPPFYGRYVQVMALSGNTLYIAGSFDSIGSAPRTALAAVNVTTGEATAWDPAPDREVRAIVVHGGLVWVGGPFSTVGGKPRAGVAALDPLTGAATTWDAHMAGADGGGAEVLALVVTNATVYAGGFFDTIGGQSRSNLAALSPATGNATSWNPGADDEVEALATDGSVMFAGGVFTHAGGQARGRLAALNLTSGAATSWVADTDKFVDAIALHGGTLYIGGSFTTVAGQPRIRLAALDAATAAVTAWDPHAGSSVFGLAASGGRVYATGAFKSLGGKSRNRLAAIDLATGAATAWNPSVTGGSVQSVVVANGTVFAGGAFTTVGATPRNGLASIDAATGAVTGWDPHPITDGANSRIIEALALDGDALYAGGWFHTIGGVPRNRVAAIDPVTGAAMPWNPRLNGASGFQVDALLPDAGRIFVGGVFDSVGGHFRRGLAAIDSTTGLDTGWSPTFNRTVSSLASLPGRIIVGTSVGGLVPPQPYLAAFDATTAATLAWNPDPNSSVYALVAVDGTVYACGGFTQIGGQERTYLAAVDATTGQATAWNPQPDGTVFTVARGFNVLYAGGSFSRVGTDFRGGLVGLSLGSGVVGVPSPARPPGFQLSAVMPNPVARAARVEFTLPRAGLVGVSVFDVAGREVERTAERAYTAGTHAWSWSPATAGRPAQAGVYFVRVRYAGRSLQRKFVLLP